MLEKEALVIVANLIRLMAAKINEPISHMRGWINVWISIAAVRLYSRIIRRARLPSHLRDQEMAWDLELVLALAQ